MPSQESLDLARVAAAQCWCTPQTSHIVMDEILCETFAYVLAGWIDEAQRYASNADFWREKCTPQPADGAAVER